VPKRSGRRSLLTRHPLLVLLPLQALLLFWHLDRLPGWDDEEFTRAVTTRAWLEAVRKLGADIHPPLYYLLAAAWLRLPWSGDPVLALRAMAALATLAAGLAAYVAWVRRADRRSRWWFAALWATSPFLLLYGRMGRSYSLQMLLGVATVAAAERLLAHPQRGRPLVAYTAAAALLLYTHYLPAAALIAAVGALLAWRMVRERDPALLVPLLTPPLVIGTAYIPWFTYLAGGAAKLASGGEYALTANPVLDTVVALGYTVIAFSGGEIVATWAVPLAALAIPVAVWIAAAGARSSLPRARFPLPQREGQGEGMKSPHEHTLSVAAPARPHWLPLVALAAALAFLAAERWVSYAFVAPRLSFVYPFWLLLLVRGIARWPRLGHVAGGLLLALAVAGIAGYLRGDGFLNKAYVIPVDSIAARIAADAPPAATLVLIDPYGANINMSVRRRLPADLPVMVLWYDALDDARREGERAALEPLVHDRVAAPRVHEQLDHRLPSVEEHEDVAGKRILAQHLADLVRQPFERHPQVGRLRREVHPHRARDQDHGSGLVSSATTVATQLGEAFAISIATPPGNRIISAAPSVMIDAGTRDTVGAGAAAGVAASRFFHQ